jgi:hypothetical protein
MDVSLGSKWADERIFRVSIVVRSHSYTEYKFLPRHLHFPHMATCCRHCTPQIKAQEPTLSDIAMITSILASCIPFADATIALGGISLDNLFLSDPQEKTLTPQLTQAFVPKPVPRKTNRPDFPGHLIQCGRKVNAPDGSEHDSHPILRTSKRERSKPRCSWLQTAVPFKRPVRPDTNVEKP